MKRIRKFSLENYIPEYHDRLDGIHYEDKKRIVTDGHYLIAVQTFYPKEMENVTLYKDFGCWKEKKVFPNWKRTLVDISQGYEYYDMNADDLSLCYKLKGSCIRFKDSGKTIGFISPKNLDVIIEFMNKFKSSRIYIPDDMHSAWKIVTDCTEIFMLVMPMCDCAFVPYEYNIARKSLTIFS